VFFSPAASRGNIQMLTEVVTAAPVTLNARAIPSPDDLLAGSVAATAND